MPNLLKLTFKSDHKIGKTLYTAGQSLTLPDVYLFGSIEQRRDSPIDFFAKSSGLVEEIALLYFQVIADITLEFDGGLMQQSDKFYADPFTDLTVTTVAFILNPSLDMTVRISGIGAGQEPTGSQPLSLTLTALAQAMPNANTMPYFTSPTSATVTPLTAVARAMLAKSSPEDIVAYLGLDDAARLEIGTGPGTVAAGDDSRITGALQSSQNLADLTDVDQALAKLGLPKGGLTATTATFATVADMMASQKITAGTMAVTQGYHRKDGHGGAQYDIWTLADYRTTIKNPTWTPDGETITVNGVAHYAGGDHTLKNGLVAILRAPILWAGQIGLEDPVKDEDDYLAKKANHDFGLQKAVDYAKKTLSFDKSTAGEGGVAVWRNRVLHIENGIYVKTKTCWVPANIYLCGGSAWGSGSREVDFIPLKPHLGGTLSTYVRDFMFIFNGNSDLANLPPDIPPGSTPAENIYIGAYVGGWSGITLHNYETSYGKKSDGSTDWYAPNYLKGIKGAMVFGGGIFHCSAGNRIKTMYHRPGVDWLEYYADAWQIFDYRANTPLENEGYQFDINGSGDAVRIEQIAFPVNHPPEDKTQPFPDGEYPNGVVKGIVLHNWASWDIRPPGEGGSQEAIAYVGAGMEIHRVINGDISIYGYRQVSINACHFEFGQVNLYQGSAYLTNCYFSKITGAKYNSINCYTGPWGGYSAALTVDSCEFHRGFDGAHQPVEEGYYDIVINNNYTVIIRDSYQGWDTGSSNNAVGLTVGIITDQKDKVIIPVPGWDRWSPYLSEEARFVRGKLVTQDRTVTWNGMEGIQDVYCTPTRSELTWDRPYGVDLYYYSQFIADIGDETVAPGFLPLGKNQRERNVLAEDGTDTGVRYEAHVFLKAPEMIDDGVQDPYLTHYRAQPAFYGENETPDSGYIRLYRGNAPFQYTEYVDLPLMSRSGVDDYGSTCFGRKWKANPMPIDTNADLKLRKRNVLPLEGAENTEYRLKIRAGHPLAEDVDLGNDFYGRKEYEYHGTGGWELAEDMKIIRASNAPVNAAIEGVMNSLTIYDRPFSADVYVSLGVTGGDNWDGSRKLKYKKGQIARIVRTEDTLAAGETKSDKALWLQSTNVAGDIVFSYNIGPGEIITAVYDEKDVFDGTNYIPTGGWIIVNHAPAKDVVDPYLYIEGENEGYYDLMPLGVVDTVARFEFANTEDVYSMVHSDNAEGCRLTITRGKGQTGIFYLLVKDADFQDVSTIEIPQTDSTITLLKKKAGWEVISFTTDKDTLYTDLNTSQYWSLTPPVGILKAYFAYNKPIPAWGDSGVLSLEHDKDGTPVPAGTFVKLYRAKTATGTPSIIVRQVNTGGDVDLATITAIGQSVEFFYDGTNWHVVGGYF